MNVNTEKASDYLSKYKDEPKLFEQDYFGLAICEVVLGNYTFAKQLFTQALNVMLGDKPYWRVSGQIDWLVHIALLTGRSDFYPSVHEELTIYRVSSTKTRPVGESPIAHYCYCLMELLYSDHGDITLWLSDLFKRPKYKDLYAAGLALRAIMEKDQSLFTDALGMVLKVHEGQVKYGRLRWSPQGWLCLSAMSLAYVGIQKGLAVNVQSDYFSKGYLNFLSLE